MSDYIKEQEQIIYNKFKVGLETLNYQLNNLDISKMHNQESFINFLKYLRECKNLKF